MRWWWAVSSVPRNFIPGRDGTGFLQNPGIPGFSGTGFASYFYPGIFWKLFGIFLFDAIGDQFKHFSRAGKPNKHFFHQKNRPANCRREDLQRFKLINTHSNNFQRKWNHFTKNLHDIWLLVQCTCWPKSSLGGPQNFWSFWYGVKIQMPKESNSVNRYQSINRACYIARLSLQLPLAE